MQILDPSVIMLIERISDHYRTNISNRFIRPILLQLPLEKATWDLIEAFTEKVAQIRYQGFHLDELYMQIAASARFVSMARRDIAPFLRNRVGQFTVHGADKVLQDMAVNNFSSNLQVFADLVNELFIKLVEIDKAAAKGRQPVYAKIPELSSIGRELVGG
jgi:hypothetical protein